MKKMRILLFVLILFSGCVKIELANDPWMYGYQLEGEFNTPPPIVKGRISND